MTEATRTEAGRRARELALSAHSGQAKGDGTPLADHVLEVASMVQQAGLGDAVVAAAALHDVLERTHTSPRDVEEGFGPEVACLVEAMTDDETILDFADRKAAQRRAVRRLGRPAVSIYAADKLTNLRRKRASLEAGTLRMEDLRLQIEVWRADAEMANAVAPDLPMVESLLTELDDLAAAAASSR